jgi:hypothetical protein
MGGDVNDNLGAEEAKEAKQEIWFAFAVQRASTIYIYGISSLPEPLPLLIQQPNVEPYLG